MIIIGLGRRTVKNYGPQKENYCDHCNNISNWELRKYTRWFTLFFIPVIPYSTKKVLVCPICGSAIELDTKVFDEMKSQEGQMGSQDNTSPNYSGKTKTQINFLKQMQEFKEDQQKVNNS
ncbi:zinc ribbon domain-containing protein [Wukongibacter sp. M2B1]|uniref:zinc ribbon domain-containing protein n=1 Tax=Wukongibacter sp. M2B1 TaxID=3088895 RepID=UPI003D7AB5A7